MESSKDDRPKDVIHHMNSAVDATKISSIHHIDLHTSEIREPFGYWKAQNGSEDPALGDPTIKTPTFFQAIRKHSKLVIYCFCLSVVVIAWGFDLVIIGSITGVESFQRDYGTVFNGDLIIPSHWLSLWIASNPLGMVLGSVFGGWFQEVVGRKFSLLFGSVTSAVGVAVIFFSYLPASKDGMRIMFFLGKILQGYSIGLLKVTAMTYISEVSPVSLRGSAMALFPQALCLVSLWGQLWCISSTMSRAKLDIWQPLGRNGF
jgi:MFS family permease